MKIIAWVLRILVLLVLVWLALLNNQMTTFSVMQGLQIDLPLIVLLFGFFILGLSLGVLILLPKYWSSKWEARGLRKENDQHRTLIADQQNLLSKYAPATGSGQVPTTPPVGSELPPFNM